MNTAAILIEEVAKSGGEVWVEGDGLKVRLPSKILPELAPRLREHKGEIIELLSRRNVIDLRAYLAKLCQRLPMPPEHLLRHYFTADDLANIRAGRYPDPLALADFIKTDPRYPFNASTNP